MYLIFSFLNGSQQKESSQLIQYRHPVSDRIQNEFKENPLQIYLTLPNYPNTLNGLQLTCSSSQIYNISFIFQLIQVIMTKLKVAANDLDFIITQYNISHRNTQKNLILRISKVQCQQNKILSRVYLI
ncbi:unnamed protein product [Paramecium octaurelia]|uniref:Uncharacterized protein n=1 Tax=Paramecium octaurelia TaxID=43137 RepID=A0A8S1SGI5_PAROT|nr:unnamed protein product [Paramecium octaurelia]